MLTFWEIYKQKLSIIFLELEKANKSRIKGEEQFIDINNSMKFLSDKVDESEKESKEKDEFIKKFQCNGKIMADKLNKLEKAMD